MFAFSASVPKRIIFLPHVTFSSRAVYENSPFDGFQIPALFHVDSWRSCIPPVEGLLPEMRVREYSKTVIRVPVHAIRRVRTPDGDVLYNATEARSALESQQYPTNRETVASSILGWRTLVVIAFGCGDRGRVSECLGELLCSLSLLPRSLPVTHFVSLPLLLPSFPASFRLRSNCLVLCYLLAPSRLCTHT